MSSRSSHYTQTYTNMLILYVKKKPPKLGFHFKLMCPAFQEKRLRWHILMFF